MPYINQERRYEIDNDGLCPQTPGELNYAITKLISNYIRAKCNVTGPITYQVINDILGALGGAGQEFYRRIVVPYEEKKIKQNGDVY